MAVRALGRVSGIYITVQAGVLPENVAKVRTTAGRGIDGDRYGAGRGRGRSAPGAGGI